MDRGIQLVNIPDGSYSDYRYEVIFGAYKWDPQVHDNNTVARHVVLMQRDTAEQLEQWAEQLSEETMQMEEALINRLALAKKLALPPDIFRALGRMKGYRRQDHVRLMRFDFHPTQEGWALSEVNSDVPGGLAEASVLPHIASRYLQQPGYSPRGHTGQAMLDSFANKIREGGRVAFVHATSYSDDRQVMQFLGDYFEQAGYQAVYCAPEHVYWNGTRAADLDAIVRFYPFEWLNVMHRKSDWTGYFSSDTPSCNHPVAIFAQSKRLPLIWDALDVELKTWKRLLPATTDPRHLRKQTGGEWILKPNLGRVGEGIGIRGAATQSEIKTIEKAARRSPPDWVAQRMFHSLPVQASDGQDYHICIGAFTVDGKSAGFYARVNEYPRIDENAQDIPILVREGEDQ